MKKLRTSAPRSEITSILAITGREETTCGDMSVLRKPGRATRASDLLCVCLTQGVKHDHRLGLFVFYVLDVFGDRDPIGQRLTFDFQERMETEYYQAVVVGVTGDVHHTSLAAPPFREAYLPLDQSPLFNYDLVVRTAISPASIAALLSLKLNTRASIRPSTTRRSAMRSRSA